MNYLNKSTITEFFLQGFSDIPTLHIPLFIVFLLIYSLTLVGNLLIIILICLDYQLHKPMYFFLGNLSILDFSYATLIQPKLLSLLLVGRHTISFVGCITQLHLFMSLTAAEFFLLSVMAYDRYVAICKPLQYPHLMNNKACIFMAVSCWIVGFLEPLSHAVVISRLPFCKSLINHFYCDYSALLKISSIDTSNIEVMTYSAGAIVGVPAFSFTLTSYVYIISTILKIHSTQGRKKAFSTCVSHLTVVILFYSTVLITIMRPSAKYSSTQGKPMSLLYTTLIPSANPFIYTLRNKDVKMAFYKLRRKRNFSFF